MAGAIEPVNTYLASHENNAFGGFYHRPKKANSSYFNYGSLTLPEVLTESPILDHALDRSTLSPTFSLSDINHHRNKEIHLGDSHFHIDIGNGDHYFFHRGLDGSPDAFSKISDNVQEFIHKNPNVHSDIVNQNVRHAVKHLGHIISDNKHSVGSRHFWENIHANFPNHRISLIHDSGEEKPIKDSSEMRTLKSTIWNPKYGEQLRLKIYDK